MNACFKSEANMINSMTGFGRASLATENLGINLEIKTLNSRYLDFHIKMPPQLNFLEEEIKKQIKAVLSRGRIDLYIGLDYLNTSRKKVEVNLPLIAQYQEALKEISKLHLVSREVDALALLNLPDVVSFKDNELDSEELQDLISKALSAALSQVKEMRGREGQYLVDDISLYLEEIEQTVLRIEALTPQIVSEHYQNLKERIKDLIGDYALEERVLAEAAILADKSDIAEELTRLKAHIAEAKLYLKGEGVVGRKIDFLIQEMNREANTIGSKSSNVDIAKDVIEIKSSLEKMREQVQNIE